VGPVTTACAPSYWLAGKRGGQDWLNLQWIASRNGAPLLTSALVLPQNPAVRGRRKRRPIPRDGSCLSARKSAPPRRKGIPTAASSPLIHLMCRVCPRLNDQLSMQIPVTLPSKRGTRTTLKTFVLSCRADQELQQLVESPSVLGAPDDVDHLPSPPVHSGSSRSRRARLRSNCRAGWSVGPPSGSILPLGNFCPSDKA
jgi:hypothetical protein